MLSGRTNIGLKRMGEIEEKPFVNTYKQRFSLEEANVQAYTLVSLWQENLKKPEWHPFKIVEVEGKTLVCLLNILLSFHCSTLLCSITFVLLLCCICILLLLMALWAWVRKIEFVLTNSLISWLSISMDLCWLIKVTDGKLKSLFKYPYSAWNIINDLFLLLGLRSLRIKLKFMFLHDW